MKRIIAILLCAMLMTSAFGAIISMNASSTVEMVEVESSSNEFLPPHSDYGIDIISPIQKFS